MIEFYVQSMIMVQDWTAPASVHPFPRHQCSLDGCEIHPLAIDMWLHAPDELSRQQGIPGRIAQLDQRLSFPIVRRLRVVTQSVPQTDCQLTFIPLRTKPQVNAKHRSLPGDAREYLGSLLGEADEIFLVRDGSLRRLLAVAVDKQQVYVGAVIQLVPAQLAQGKNRESGVRQAPFRVDMLRSLIPPLQMTVGFPQRVFDQHIGKCRNLGCGLGQGRDLQYIAQHDAHVFAPFETCQQQRHICLKRPRPEACQSLVKLFPRKTSIKVFFSQKRLQQVGILDQRFAQIAAVSKDSNGVVREEVLALQQPHHVSSWLANQPVKEHKGRIRIGNFQQQGRQSGCHTGRNLRCRARKILPRRFRMLERDAGHGRSNVERLPRII